MKPRLHVLDNGKLHLDRSILVGHATLGTVDNKHAPADWTSVPTFSILIEHEEGRILFDSGCNPESHTRWPEAVRNVEYWEGPEECHLPNRLEQLGLGPKDVDVVVASHLHSDHAGCLEYFTDSTVIVHRDELRGALEHYATPGYAGGYIKDDIEKWIRNGIKWHIIDRHEDDIPIYDGIRLLNLGSGHVEGILGLQVTLPETGTLILASDACYGRQNAGLTPALPGIVSVYDSIGMVQTSRRLHYHAQRVGGEIWYGHDPEQFAAMRKSPDAYYE